MPELLRNRGLIYARLSDRALDDISTDRQIEQVLAEFQSRGILCDPQQDVFVEDVGYHSGRFTHNRHAYQEFLKRLEGPDIGFVGFTNSDRPWRSVAEFRRVVDLLRARNIVPIATHDPTFEIQSAKGLLVATIQAAINEYNPNKTSEDAKKNIADWKTGGGKWGRAPLGLTQQGKRQHRTFVASEEGYYLVNGQLVVGAKPSETTSAPFAVSVNTYRFITYLETLSTWIELYTSQDIGLYLGSVELNQRGYRWRNMQGIPVPVEPRNLWRLGANQLHHYIGILPDTLLDKFQAKLAERAGRKANGRRHKHPKPLLWRILYCDECGTRFISQTNQRGTHYRHNTAVCASHVESIAHILNDKVLDLLEPIMRLTDAQKLAIAEQAAMSERTPDAKINQRERLTEQLTRIKDAYFNLLISKDEFLRRTAELNAQRQALPLAPPHTAHKPASPAEAVRQLNDVFDIVDDESMDPDTVNRAMRSLFQAIYVRKTEIHRIQVHQWCAPWFETLLDTSFMELKEISSVSETSNE